MQQILKCFDMLKIRNEMKTQRNRVSIVVIHKNKILGFHAEDPYSKKKYFFLPGGMIESGESADQAAQRETLEETGYLIDVINGVNIKRRYDFEWNGKTNDCATEFLAGKLISEKAISVDDASYHRGVDWLPISEVRTIFGYHKDILEPIELIVKISEKV